MRTIDREWQQIIERGRREDRARLAGDILAVIGLVMAVFGAACLVLL